MHYPHFVVLGDILDFLQVRGTKYWEKPEGKKKGKYIHEEHVVGYIGESNPKEDWKTITANYALVCRAANYAIVRRLKTANGTDKPHPYKVYYLQYISDKPGLRHPEAAAAKAYWHLELCTDERNRLVAEQSGNKAAAIKAFKTRFKYRLK